MKKPCLLGIDLGTSSVKVAVVHANTVEILAVASGTYPLHYGANGIVEQHPEDWWQATIHAVRQALAKVDATVSITAIGFSGQMHGTVLLDENGKPLCPAIIWADQRSTESVNTIIDTIGLADYVNITGTRPATGFMGSTLVWLRDHQPDLLQQVTKVLLPKDYIRYRMTGMLATDVTDAAATGLYDIGANHWSQTIIAALELPLDIFPDVLQSHDRAGTLTTAKELGLPAGTPVMLGCADQAAQALGNGIIQTGTASITIGTGGQVFMPVSHYYPDERLHTFRHVTGDYYALGAILSAGHSFNWLRETIMAGLSLDEINTAIAEIPAGAEGLLYLPYLNGERTPHNDPHARGAFIGLSGKHTAAHLARAVMEGVAFALHQVYELCAKSADSIDTLVLSGGAMTHSAIWRQIMADVLQRDVVHSQREEQAALGAALIAGVGMGYYGADTISSFEQVRQLCATYRAATSPIADNRMLYDARYQHYCELYPRLADDMHRLVR